MRRRTIHDAVIVFAPTRLRVPNLPVRHSDNLPPISVNFVLLRTVGNPYREQGSLWLPIPEWDKAHQILSASTFARSFKGWSKTGVASARTLVAAIPVVARWSALSNNKYRVKLQPGSIKKDKVLKEIVGR